MTRLIVVLAMLSFSQSSFGQLYLDGEGNVGIGVQTSAHARTTILNETEQRTLQIINKSNNYSMYGIDILVDSVGAGPKLGIVSKVNQKPGGSGEVVAFKAFVHPNGGGNTYGFLSLMDSTGTGVKYGYSSSVQQGTQSAGTAIGVYNQIKQNGTGGTRGVSTLITQNGSGQLEGEYNTITQHGSGQTYSSRNSITQNGDGYTVGVGMNITQNGEGQTFGIQNYISANNEDNTNTLYGFHSTMAGTSTTTPKVGIYSHATGANAKAASFVGDVYISGTLVQSSDARLKEQIEAIPNALDIVRVLQPKQYHFKDLRHHGNDSNTQQFGFLAQDVERFLPNIVKTVIHPGRIVQVAAPNGRGTEFQRLEDDEDVKSVNYIAIIPILTQAIKEQQELIQTLLERVQELEDR